MTFRADDVQIPNLFNFLTLLFHFFAAIDLSDQHKVSILGIVSTEAFDRDVDDILDAEVVAETSQEVVDFDEDKILAAMTWRNLIGQGFVESSVYYRSTARDALIGRAEPMVSDLGTLDQPSDFSIRDTRAIDDNESEVGLRSVWTNVLSDNANFRTGIDWTSTWFDNRFRLLGRDTLRMQNVLISAGSLDEKTRIYLRDFPNLVVIENYRNESLYRQFQLPGFDEVGAIPKMYLVDPDQNLMMHYPAEYDQDRVLEDIRKLMKLSQIG